MSWTGCSNTIPRLRRGGSRLESDYPDADVRVRPELGAINPDEGIPGIELVECDAISLRYGPAAVSFFNKIK